RVDNLEASRVVPRDRLERGNGAPVMLDGDDMRRTQREQRAGQPAGSGPDLDHGRTLKRARGASDARSEVEVEQEILTKRFPSGQRMLANDFAQRRQVVDRAHCAPGLGAFCLARRAASRKAAIRLAGLARPLPAMSKAVP